MGGPALVGATFATVASLLRRRYGSRALLAVTVVATGLAVILVKRLDLVGVLFVLPAIPATVIAAGVLEWRARRDAGARLWHHVAWGTAAFVPPAAGGVAATLSSCTLCGL